MVCFSFHVGTYSRAGASYSRPFSRRRIMRSSEILLQQLVAQLVDEISSTVAQRVHDRLDAKDTELHKLRDRVALLEEKVDSLETQDVPAETGQSAKPVDGEHVRRYLTISEVPELHSIHEQTLRGYKDPAISGHSSSEAR